MANPDYFTLDEFRALPDMADVDPYSDAAINAAAAYFTTIVEREVGEPFVPRTLTETLDGSGLGALIVSQPSIRSVGSLTVGGVAVDASQLTTTGGVLRYRSTGSAFGTAWTSGVGNIVITYTAGRYATCPADIKDAVMWATRDRLLGHNDQNDVDVRRTSMTNDYGTTNYVLPGEKRPTGYPDLDALIASYLRTTPSLGFA